MEIAFVGTKGIPARYGGFETVVEKVSITLAKKGYKCIVYAVGNPKKYKIKNIKIINLPQIGIPSIDRVIREIFPLIHLFFKRKIVFQIYGPFMFMWFLRLLRKKNVLSADGLEWLRHSYSPLIRTIVFLAYNIGIKLAQAVTTDSKFIKRWFLKNWDRKSFYVPYGPRNNIKTANFNHHILNKNNLKPNEYYLFVGRLVPEKGIHNLIKAFKNVKTTKKLVILGNDPMVGSPYKKKLLQLANKDVKFLDPVFGQDFLDICNSCYVNIRPSINKSEGINPFTIESLGFGNCIIASDAPQNLEALGDAALIYSKHNVKSLEVTIKKVETNYDLVQKYRKRALKRVNKFSWSKIINKIEKIYHSL
jgi:glycosyltransferase involved in cell wall biosynthesis